MGEAEPPRWRVSKGQRSRAKALRGNPTDAEQHLWSALRGHRLNGLSFRRQHPLGPYVADFACLPAKLVIEVDGGQHYEDAGRRHDARRDSFLSEHGFTVLRFSNLDILGNLSGVLETINAVARPAALPPPQPSPASGRGSNVAMVEECPRTLTRDEAGGTSAPGVPQADQDKDHLR